VGASNGGLILVVLQGFGYIMLRRYKREFEENKNPHNYFMLGGWCVAGFAAHKESPDADDHRSRVAVVQGISSRIVSHPPAGKLTILHDSWLLYSPVLQLSMVAVIFRMIDVFTIADPYDVAIF